MILSSMNTEPTPNNSLTREARFDAAFERLAEAVDLSRADDFSPSSPQTVYTASVVLWLLIVQRLDQDLSLRDAVSHLIETQPDLLPDNKRVADGTLSTSTGAYSNGRSRLTMEVVMWLAESVSASLIEASPASFAGQRVFLLDGTTLSLAPEEDLKEEFPPAVNQHGSSPWPLTQMVVAHEMSSGVALPPEVGPMYGPDAVSETALISQHLRRIPRGSIVLADSAYGIFRVVRAIDQSGKHYALRMTKARFRSLRRKATLASEGPNWKTYDHLWTPSKQERRDHPDLPDDAEVLVRLHEVELESGETLYLVTDLSASAEEIADLYAMRWSVETDIAHLKITLNVENIRAKSVDMFLKELMVSTVAYNLTGQFRRQAAEAANVPPRRMSFTGIWGVFRIFLLKHVSSDPAAWRAQFDQALNVAKKHKLPNRPGRSYPREAYKRRPKSMHFKKRPIKNPPQTSSKTKPK